MNRLLDNNLYEKNYKGIQYFTSDLVSSAMVIGIKGKIILPSVDFDKELDDILLHEMQHIKNRDILKKYIMEIIVCVYWWYFPIYKLRKELDLIIEMNVDYMITSKREKDEFISYAQNIVSVMRKTKSNLSYGFSVDEGNNIKYRIQYLLDGYRIQHTNAVILYFLILLSFFSTLFVFEPIENNVSGIYDRINSDDTYIIHYDDTYRLFIDGVDIGLIHDIYDNSLKGIEIIGE